MIMWTQILHAKLKLRSFLALAGLPKLNRRRVAQVAVREGSSQAKMRVTPRQDITTPTSAVVFRSLGECGVAGLSQVVSPDIGSLTPFYDALGIPPELRNVLRLILIAHKHSHKGFCDYHFRIEVNEPGDELETGE